MDDTIHVKIKVIKLWYLHKKRHHGKSKGVLSEVTLIDAHLVIFDDL